MKNFIKIISACDNNYKQLSDLSFSTVEKFCKVNNFLCERFLIKDFNRPASWFKIEKIIEEMESSKTKYFMWIDADALIYNMNFNLESILSTNKNFYVSKDLNNFNLGVFIIKNNEFSLNLLKKIYSMTEYDHHIWWEQAAFIDLFEKNYNFIQDNVEIVEQCILNAYDYRYYGSNENNIGHYNKDSFVIHFPALSYDLRFSLINKLL
jgi:hypothetical protein